LDADGDMRASSETILYAFEPDARRAANLDRNIRFGLAKSLTTVLESLDDRFCVKPDDWHRLLQDIESGPVRPRAFGLYVDLVLALLDERLDDARALLALITDGRIRLGQSLHVTTLDDTELGPGEADRYRRLLADDLVFEMEAIPHLRRAGAEALLADGLDLIAAGAPELAAEVRALVHEVVLVTGQKETAGQVLGGASSFALWGAVFQNIDQRVDRLGMALSLTHEAAHLHLFGLADGGRLVENSDEERFASPLRRDPRPMEGIAHATFVLARLAYALRRFLAAGVLTGDETDRARVQLEECCRGFEDGQQLARIHAKFKHAGAAALEDAGRYMSEAAAQDDRLLARSR
jgi:hypothetical protein